MRIKGKKALGELMVELVFSIMLLGALFIALLFVSHNQTLKVHATIEAEKSEFDCRNDLVAIMNFKYNDNMDYREKLILSYIKEDYEDFETKFENTMNKFSDPHSWSLVIEGGSKKLIGAEQLLAGSGEGIVICSMSLPLPCTEDCGNCALEVTLTERYEK